MADELVALLHRRDALGRAGEDEVARLQPHRLRDLGDELGHAPNQHRDVALLPRLAVDLQLDPAFRDVAALARRDEARAGRRMVEAFAEIPRPAELLRLALNVAPGHVEPDAITEDVFERLLYRDNGATVAD